jgi:hypothetical protein
MCKSQIWATVLISSPLFTFVLGMSILTLMEM